MKAENIDTMNQKSEKEISLEQFKSSVKDYSKYILSKRWIILAIVLIAACLGVVYAWMQKPVFKAELTYATGDESSGNGIAGYAGLAAQFGFDVNSSGNFFEGDNLMQLLKSRLLLQKTFLTPVDIGNGKELLINYFIKSRKLDKEWENSTSLKKVIFTSDYRPGIRVQDSLMIRFCNEIADDALQIEKIDKKLDMVSVTLKDYDEFFAKNFVEQLVNNAIQYYTDYKSKKARQNVEILERQRDSLRRLITGNITSIAVSNDVNVNPIKQVSQVGTQKKQVDIRVSSALYEELVKNLEISKMSLRRETPFIQVIDTPLFPLEKKKMGRLYTAFLFAFIAGVLMVVFFFFKKMLDI